MITSISSCINRAPYSFEEEDKDKIALSVFMTKDEIINKLGEDYTIITEEGMSHTDFHTKLEYDGITFHYYHDEEVMPESLLPGNILLESNDYTYNFDIELEANALSLIRYFRTQFDRYFDIHRGDFAFDLFKYRERRNGTVVDTDYIIKLIYEDGEFYISRDEISSDLKVVAISIFIPL